MVVKKPKIVIIGAGIAGLTAANKLYTTQGSKDLFELCVVEGGNRIGGRINTSEFGGDRIEMGATWIHGIEGSPVHKIAEEIGSLESEQPWECMDGLFPDELVTIAEGGYKLNPSLVKSVSGYFDTLMNFAQGKVHELEEESDIDVMEHLNLAKKAFSACARNGVEIGNLSVGSFLRKGLDLYFALNQGKEEPNGYGNWTKKALQEVIFSIHENTQRIYTGASDLLRLDYHAESEYVMFPGEEITIAKGYTSIVKSIASVLPMNMVQVGKRVLKIEWKSDNQESLERENGHDLKPVTLHLSDGSVMLADHVIVTVSLGVLKAGIKENLGMFDPPLPSYKKEAISKLGYGVVNKLFLELRPTSDFENKKSATFPCLQLGFHQAESEFRHSKIPWWMRKTASLCPLHRNSTVLLAWFAGKEALEVESLEDEQIINGVTTTVSSFLSKEYPNSHVFSNRNLNFDRKFEIGNVLRSKWGTDPLFLGSYSYVSVGSSLGDVDKLAEPLPKISTNGVKNSPQLQILFAGEATHRTHYSTTHGAYFSGLREANRLLQHYHCVGL